MGTITYQPHTGNFPEFHPNDDDAHLHIEIRAFADARSIGLPANCTNGAFGMVGPRYTYSGLPDAYGYMDPIKFIITNQMTRKRYLPFAIQGSSPAPNCQNGQDILQNGGLEFGPVITPTSWTTVSTMNAYYTPLATQNFGHNDRQRSIFLGNWMNGQSVDEEIEQSFVAPLKTINIVWESHLYFTGSPDSGDYLRPGLYQNATGL